jgi:hypothetical protein
MGYRTCSTAKLPAGSGGNSLRDFDRTIRLLRHRCAEVDGGLLPKTCGRCVVRLVYGESRVIVVIAGAGVSGLFNGRDAEASTARLCILWSVSGWRGPSAAPTTLIERDLPDLNSFTL